MDLPPLFSMVGTSTMMSLSPFIDHCSVRRAKGHTEATLHPKTLAIASLQEPGDRARSSSQSSETSNMLSKRKSLNDDLIIWHGMSAQNISIAVAQGLSFAARRRKIWLEIVSVEVQKKSKSIEAQNFAFSTRRPTIVSQTFSMASGKGKDTLTMSDNEASFVEQPIEVRVNEVIETSVASLPIQVNAHNVTIITKLTAVIASEMLVSAEASKVLSFLLYREQVPSNRRPCIPTDTESHVIYTDVFEACIHVWEPYLYKQMLLLGVDRESLWTLFRVFISTTLPLVLRVRFLDLALVKGCIVFVPAMLAYLSWRRKAFMAARTSAEFVACFEQPHTEWLQDDQLDAFWLKCVGSHKQQFLDWYADQIARMRLKAVSMAKQRDPHEPLLQQLQREIFHHARYSWIGFDVDHTLVEYRLPYLLQTSFTQATKELQQNFIGLRASPPAKWLPDIAQRGIVVDTARGNFLHLGEDGSIQRAYHGSHEVSYFSINLLYSGTSVGSSDGITGLLGGSSKFIQLYTAADIIYAPLYAWIVDAFDSGVIAVEELGASLYLVPDIEESGNENPNDPFLANKIVYVSLSAYVLKAARAFYAGAFWKTVSTSPEVLIQPNADILSLLETLKTVLRKQLFILTNGSWTHCNAVMQFAVSRDWLTYFDLVVTEANKEIFFDELNDTPFSEVILDSNTTGEGSNSTGRRQKKLVTILQRRKIYAHGNLKTLMAFFRETPSSSSKSLASVSEKDQRICYFGDHMLQDVLLPAQHASKWDLVAIVREIHHLNQDTKEDECSSTLSWLTQMLYRRSSTATPGLHSSFFFLGLSGSASYFGSKVCSAATMCLSSVGKLARCEGVLKASMIHQSGRFATSTELGSLRKRMVAKVRTVET